MQSGVLTQCWAAENTPPAIILPRVNLLPKQLAIIVNNADPLSVEIADYYQLKRHIPSENRIEISIDPTHTAMAPKKFSKLRATILSRTLQHVQAYAITWTQPYRVGCMSITSAIGMGYDAQWCAKRSCRVDEQQAYFDSSHINGFEEYRIRPTMAIAARSFSEARKLIDRGIAADGSMPAGVAYLVNTSDKNRNVRSAQYEQTQHLFSPWLQIQTLKTDYLENKHDILFYITGLVKVPSLNTLSFLPGAIADHLTSTGGQLTDSRQMSSLRWLEAGATASYGSVTEPCNYPQKFPMPSIVLNHYLRGESVLQAYWKSVMWPREGIFIGEPLAAPFAGYRIKQNKKEITLKTYSLVPGRYQIYSSPSLLGPFNPERFVFSISPGQTEFTFPNFGQRAYTFKRKR